MGKRPKRGRLPWSVVLVLSLGAGGCAVNPATGERQLSLMGEREEIALGQKADREVLSSMGTYPDGKLEAYVRTVGESLAATSERPELPWTFRVVDSPVINAFALPGGYIYVTRGILAYLDSEAELAAVLGHEIGHVTARHSVTRMSKAQLLGLGLGVGRLVSPGFARLSGLVEQGLGLLFLKYSRDDERQADSLGLRYVTRARYDAREMPKVFAMLGRVSQATGGGRVPAWLSTHPEPEARRERIESAIAESGADYRSSRRGREQHLARLEGMVFGEDPRQGYFEGSLFRHPQLAFEMRFPDGWTTVNERQRVAALNAGKDVLVQITIAAEASPQEAMDRFLAQDGVDARRRWSGRLHGLEAAWSTFDAGTDGSSVSGRVGCVTYGGLVFQLLGYGTAEAWPKQNETVAASLESFRKLTDRAALEVEPARLRIVHLERNLTVEEFQRRYPSSLDLEAVALLNRVAAAGRLPAPGEFKRVVGGPGR